MDFAKPIEELIYQLSRLMLGFVAIMQMNGFSADNIGEIGRAHV